MKPATTVLTGKEAKSAEDFVEGEWMLPPKHESATQPGLYFFAERFELRPGPSVWVVMSQAKGFPATEAFDDWLFHFKDADDIAHKLARGEDCGGHL